MKFYQNTTYRHCIVFLASTFLKHVQSSQDLWEDRLGCVPYHRHCHLAMSLPAGLRSVEAYLCLHQARSFRSQNYCQQLGPF